MTSELAKNLEKILGEVDTWELAEEMLEVYREAAKQASGNAECRKIVRMQAVVKAMQDKIRQQVFWAEKESA